MFIDVRFVKYLKEPQQMPDSTYRYLSHSNHGWKLAWILYWGFHEHNEEMIPSLSSSTASTRWLNLFPAKKRRMQFELLNSIFKRSISYMDYPQPLSLIETPDFLVTFGDAYRR